MARVPGGELGAGLQLRVQFSREFFASPALATRQGNVEVICEEPFVRVAPDAKWHGADKLKRFDIENAVHLLGGGKVK